MVSTFEGFDLLDYLVDVHFQCLLVHCLASFIAKFEETRRLLFITSQESVRLHILLLATRVRVIISYGSDFSLFIIIMMVNGVFSKLVLHHLT